VPRWWLAAAALIAEAVDLPLHLVELALELVDVAGF
jgi:hypothetical protein